MIIEESRIRFSFSEESKAIKYDECSFFKKYMNRLPGAKGVDFISVQNNSLVFTEIKNCKGDEANNNWRIYPDNKKNGTSRTVVNTDGRDSLDIEVSKKVAMTISALNGAYTKASGCQAAEELEKYANILISQGAKSGHNQLLVILFLEGDFGCETRRKKTIMRELERSIKKKLSWMNCLVSVVDSHTYRQKIFECEVM